MDYKGLKELLEGCINDKSEEFPGELDSLIADTARTGIVRLPWDLLKPLFNYRLKKVLVASFDELALEGEDKTLYQQLLDQLNKFDNPPFTIQRVCELIVEPTRHYKRRDRYMRAMERCLLVVSTQEPDLTWMKSPRLTQLLEEPPKESLQEVVFDENMVNEYASVPASGSTTNLWSNLRQATNDDLKDVKMRLLNLKNNIGTSDATHQTGDDSPSGETPDRRPKTERQLSDTSTCNSIYSGFFPSHQFVDVDDSDIMSVGIESNVSLIDRDVHVFRRKKITDPSPAYRQQLYAQRPWRFEQDNLAVVDSLSTLSLSTRVDESDDDINVSLLANHTKKQYGKTIGRTRAEHRLQEIETSSDDSHWSIIILQRDLQN